MIPELTLAHAALAEQRIREAARARALDYPEPAGGDHDPQRWTTARAAWRQVAQALRSQQRTVPAAPNQRPAAA